MTSLWLGLLILCGCENQARAPAPATPQPPTTPAQPTALAAAAEPEFLFGGLRCLYVAPEGELLSCEEISQAGVSQPSAQENCAMLGAALTPGECPSANRVGRCFAMDGPELTPVYPIRIHYYLSFLIPDPARAQVLCSELDGTFVPEP